jgi:hypothetical protein
MVPVLLCQFVRCPPPPPPPQIGPHGSQLAGPSGQPAEGNCCADVILVAIGERLAGPKD